MRMSRGQEGLDVSGDVEAAFVGIEEVPYFGPILGSKRGASDTLHRSSGGVAAVGRDEELVVVTKVLNQIHRVAVG